MKIYDVNIVLFEGKYCFFTDEYGGAIISHKNLDKGKLLFEEGMHLAIAVKNFIVFTENRKDLWEFKYDFKYKEVIKLTDLIKKKEL